MELVSEQGIAPLTLREVARRAGVSHAAPYHHFVDKTALLAAVAEEGFRALLHRMQEAKKDQASAQDALHAVGVAYVRYAVQSPSHFRIMFSQALADRTAHSALEAAGNATFQLLVDTAAEAVKASETDPMSVALLGWSLVHGVATLYLDGMLQTVATDAEAVADELISLAMRGVSRR